jgi:hypothetical protein
MGTRQQGEIQANKYQTVSMSADEPYFIQIPIKPKSTVVATKKKAVYIAIDSLFNSLLSPY